jgi:hypothetical protein
MFPTPAVASFGAPHRWAKEIAAVRQQCGDRFYPQPQAKAISGRARITGIGSFGRANPRGAPENTTGVQLHRAIKLEWLPDPPDTPR